RKRDKRTPTASCRGGASCQFFNRLFLTSQGGRVLPPSTSRAALRPDVILILRESPSARTRGLRPASPALALWLPRGCEPGEGPFPVGGDERGSTLGEFSCLKDSATERPATARQPL